MAAYCLKFQRFFQNITVCPSLNQCYLYSIGFPRYLHLSEYSHDSSKGNKVRIGCASGFWGDSAVAAPQLIHKGDLDYLVFDYLSEVTMSLLTVAKQKKPDLGYAPDFVQIAIAPHMKDIKEKGLCVISNGGGVNPEYCAVALQEAARRAGVVFNIATIIGDDIMPRKNELLNERIKEMDSGRDFPNTMHSMNAYLGAGAISRALDLGADLVITGRCVDSALVLAPLLHVFKWAPQNFDLMASGSLAGHLIECGAQATGGIFTDWHTVPDWHNIGFPIVECEENGAFTLTKPPDTGGLVTFGTVAEQLVYEIGDPQNYKLPDVVCDFSQVKIEPLSGQEGIAVRVSGARGKPPTNMYKVSGTYAAGFRATAVCPVGGPRAAQKGHKTAKAIIARCRGIFKQLGFEDFTSINIQILGSEQTYGPHANKNISDSVREVVIWLAVQHTHRKALEIFAREIAPAGTGMAPGLMGIAGGRPKVSPVLKLYSFLYPKENIKPQIFMNGEFVEEYQLPSVPTAEYPLTNPRPKVAEQPTLPRGNCTFRLEDLAYTRSGDKGNTCNIGVVARHPNFVPFLRQHLTADKVQAYFSHVFSANTCNNITRYELPGVGGLNFVLRNSLGGGGIASIRSDPQGKAFGQMLLDFKLENLPFIEEMKNFST